MFMYKIIYYLFFEHIKSATLHTWGYHYYSPTILWLGVGEKEDLTDDAATYTNRPSQLLSTHHSNKVVDVDVICCSIPIPNSGTQTEEDYSALLTSTSTSDN